MSEDWREVPCEHCGGEGKLYTSRYGGNDPDVWPIGDCPVCEGTGYELVLTEPLDDLDVESMRQWKPLS